MSTQDYSKLTVKELKSLIKERNVIYFNCTKKIDYIQALKDDDSDNKSMATFRNYVGNITSKMAEDKQKISETKQKLLDTTNLYDSKINELKQKDNKTTDDYEKLVMLLEKRIKLAEISI